FLFRCDTFASIHCVGVQECKSIINATMSEIFSKNSMYLLTCSLQDLRLPGIR
ncbi:hypothetical protein TNIN_170021, partial [Trichonephila inaurata madagascariensis]